MNHPMMHVLAAAAVFVILAGSATAEPMFEGKKKCYNCHKSQGKSWDKTAHAKAVNSLKPEAREKAKLKAKLDPKKDYTEDKDCIGCHVTGFGEEGGYIVQDPDKFLRGVGCESCHGAGSDYRKIHRKKGERFEKAKETASRESLAEVGEDFEFIEACNACHLNYEGSGWKGTKKPYTPFTPEVDKKYVFDFDKSVQDSEAMHEHFKLEGTFTGPPVFKFHKEFQAKAKPLPADEEE